MPLGWTCILQLQYVSVTAVLLYLSVPWSHIHLRVSALGRGESRRSLTSWASFTGLLWGVNERIPVIRLQKHWHIASIPQSSTFQTIYKKMKGSLLWWGRLWWLWAFIPYNGVWISGEAMWGCQASCLTPRGLSFPRGPRRYVCKYLYCTGLLTDLNEKDAFNQAQWLSLLIFSVSKAGEKSVDQSQPWLTVTWVVSPCHIRRNILVPKLTLGWKSTGPLTSYLTFPCDLNSGSLVSPEVKREWQRNTLWLSVLHETSVQSS